MAVDNTGDEGILWYRRVFSVMFVPRTFPASCSPKSGTEIDRNRRQHCELLLRSHGNERARGDIWVARYQGILITTAAAAATGPPSESDGRREQCPRPEQV
jgi:hypothetical protein